MEPQKILTVKIDNYRNSRNFGKIKVVTHVDVYGNISAAVEQTTHDSFTGEERVLVAAPITLESINEGLERVQAQLQKGDPNNPEDIGIESIKTNIESSKKQVQLWEKRLVEREKFYAEEISNLEAMRDDVSEALEKAKKEREETVKAAAEAAKKVVEKSGAKGAN